MEGKKMTWPLLPHPFFLLNYEAAFRMFQFYLGPSSSSFIKYLLWATEQVFYRNVILHFCYKE